jgi:hypothetical protein
MYSIHSNIRGVLATRRHIVTFLKTKLYTEGSSNLSADRVRTVPYRTVPYRNLPFSVRAFFTLAVSKREVYRFFCLKFSVFPLKSQKRTVFKIETVLAF